MPLPWTRALRRLFRPTRIARRPAPFRPRLDVLEERCLPTAYAVTTTKDLLGDTTAGELTLRDALTAISTQAASGNAPAGTATNSVTFAVGAPGSTQTISLTSALPAVTHQVTLDGLSQGPSGNATPLIVLNGSGAGASANGLTLQAGSDGSTVRGFVVQGFGGTGVVLNGTSNDTVASNYVGTDASGTSRVGNGLGVLISGTAKFNTVGVGATIQGQPLTGANVISGNGYGVEVTGAGASLNRIAGNLIGTDASGAAALGNTNIGVVILDSAEENVVGGLVPGTGNVIAGSIEGVLLIGLGTSSNDVWGNFIGTNKAGAAALPNAGGVAVGGNATGNAIGGGVGIASGGNVISGNTYGVVIADPGTNHNGVLGNRIGTTADGTRPLGNAVGVLIRGGAAVNSVGGEVIISDTASPANVISGNGVGVLLDGAGTTQNVVQSNFIGTDQNNTAGLGNTYSGVLIEAGATANTVGGTVGPPTPGGAIGGNVISGNANGVVLQGAGTVGNVVAGNLIGTDPSGTAAHGNGVGVVIDAGAASNTVGGTAAGEGNVLSGNTYGLELTGSGTSNNTVVGNRIGTNAAATAKLPNQIGVVIADEASANLVGASGSSAFPTNIISGNTDGVVLTGAGTAGNVVAGNHIGTDSRGSVNLGNAAVGVLIEAGASGNTIGSIPNGGGNQISFNGVGVLLDGAGTGRNVIQTNQIGTGFIATAAAGNAYGVLLQNGASGNTVGGTASGAGNTIAFNTAEGVTLLGGSTVGDSVLSNSIYSNAGLGIDLGGPLAVSVNPGPLPNDGQSAPVVHLDNGSTASGTLASVPNTTFLIQVFGTPAGQAPGQGFVLLGSATVTTDANGNATFTADLVGSDAVITATATNLATGDTSEFSS